MYYSRNSWHLEGDGGVSGMTLDELATGFEYESEKTDNWRILKLDQHGKCNGDCDDYACTALYIVTGSLWGFWKALILGDAKIHYVITANGGGHAVLGYKDEYIDNWSRKFVSKNFMQSTYGHNFHGWLFPWFVTAIKMAAGKLFRRVQNA